MLQVIISYCTLIPVLRFTCREVYSMNVHAQRVWLFLRRSSTRQCVPWYSYLNTSDFKDAVKSGMCSSHCFRVLLWCITKWNPLQLGSVLRKWDSGISCSMKVEYKKPYTLYHGVLNEILINSYYAPQSPKEFEVSAEASEFATPSQRISHKWQLSGTSLMHRLRADGGYQTDLSNDSHHYSKMLDIVPLYLSLETISSVCLFAAQSGVCYSKAFI